MIAAEGMNSQPGFACRGGIKQANELIEGMR